MNNRIHGFSFEDEDGAIGGAPPGEGRKRRRLATTEAAQPARRRCTKSPDTALIGQIRWAYEIVGRSFVTVKSDRPDQG